MTTVTNEMLHNFLLNLIEAKAQLREELATERRLTVDLIDRIIDLEATLAQYDDQADRKALAEWRGMDTAPASKRKEK
jgi:hypothetical protein